jgi:hypothetical protein
MVDNGVSAFIDPAQFRAGDSVDPVALSREVLAYASFANHVGDTQNHKYRLARVLVGVEQNL